MIRQGDILQIPLPDGRLAHGWVVLVSQYFKDTVGFVVFGVDGKLLDVDIMLTRKTRVLGTYYTHSENFDAYNCKIVDRAIVSTAEFAMLTTRICAGGVWIGDEYIRPASRNDYTHLKEMTWIGMPNVFKLVEDAFPTPSKDISNARCLVTTKTTEFFTMELETVDQGLIEALSRIGYL